MSKDNIIRTLTTKLADDELASLRNQTTNKQFFERLISIYERRTLDYLQSCEKKVKKVLQEKNSYSANVLSAATTYHIIEFAYSAILETDKTSFLLSLDRLLKNESPGLAVSLGMNILYKTQNGSKGVYPLQAQLSAVFTAYIARYRLFKEVDYGDLNQLCTEMSNEDPNIFPNYLLQSFSLQKQIGDAVERAIANRREDQTTLWASVLADSMRQGGPLFNLCLAGLVKYVSKILSASHIPNQYQQQFFNHLQNDQTLLNFANNLCTGYLQQMASNERQLEVYAANSKVLQAEEISRICMPALSLLGLNVQIDTNSITVRQNELNNVIAKVRENQSAIDQKANELKSDANRKIDEALANFKPEWNVGFGSGVGTPNIKFHF